MRLSLQREKASEFTAFTERNLKKNARLVINEKTIGEPLINSKITGGSLILECKTTDEAAALAKYLMQKIPNKVPEPASAPAASEVKR